MLARLAFSGLLLEGGAFDGFVIEGLIGFEFEALADESFWWFEMLWLFEAEGDGFCGLMEGVAAILVHFNVYNNSGFSGVLR